MNWTITDEGSQAGRLAVVTGANIGLGYDTALALASKGCAVILACRNMDKASTAKDRILNDLPEARIECLALDLSSQSSVRSFAAAFGASHQRLDLLINNAGIMMPPYSLSEDGFESQLAANYLGHFTLTGLLLPMLLATPRSRVVSLSSLAHRWGGIRLDDLNFSTGYNKRLAYGQSKLACLMFSFELDRRLRRNGHETLSVAAHPGVAATNLGQHFPKFMSALFPLIGQSAKDGAMPTLYAALGADIRGGDFCGPRSLHQMRGAPIKVGCSRTARDKNLARKLWALSEDLTTTRFLSEP